MRRFVFVIIFLTLFLACGLMFGGCGNQSTIKVSACEPNSLNGGIVEASGPAAEAMAKRIGDVLAQNQQTREGRVNAVVEQLKKYAGVLMLAFVGGIAFWAFTKSRYGWVIPAASLGGLLLITFWSRFAEYVAYGVGIVAVGTLIWKSVEYHKERDIERAKNVSK